MKGKFASKQNLRSGNKFETYEAVFEMQTFKWSCISFKVVYEKKSTFWTDNTCQLRA